MKQLWEVETGGRRDPGGRSSERPGTSVQTLRTERVRMNVTDTYGLCLCVRSRSKAASVVG